MVINEWIHMQKLNRDREVLVWVPDNYEVSGKRYPVLYIQDGQNAFFDNEAYAGISWGFLDHVYRMQLDIIMVAVKCNFEPYMRESEYGVWKTPRAITIMETGKPGNGLGGEGAAYVNFLIEELKPFIDSKYPTIPTDTAICGSSAGANISVYAALTFPEIFPKCAALSSAFWYYPDEYMTLAAKADLQKLQCFYFDRGTNEGNGNTFVNDLYRFDNDEFYEILSRKPGSEKVHYRVIDGAFHSEYDWRKRVPIFLDLFYRRNA